MHYVQYWNRFEDDVEISSGKLYTDGVLCITKS